MDFKVANIFFFGGVIWSKYTNFPWLIDSSLRDFVQVYHRFGRHFPLTDKFKAKNGIIWGPSLSSIHDCSRSHLGRKWHWLGAKTLRRIYSWNHGRIHVRLGAKSVFNTWMNLLKFALKSLPIWRNFVPNCLKKEVTKLKWLEVTYAFASRLQTCTLASSKLPLVWIQIVFNTSGWFW